MDDKRKFHGLDEWLESGKYLPEFMRDFHDQKEIFKSIHDLYSENDSASEIGNWRQAHVYTVDWFLWYMAGRGYTLQRSRKDLEFRPFHNWRDSINSFPMAKNDQQ